MFRVGGFHGRQGGDVEEVTGFKSLMLWTGHVTEGCWDADDRWRRGGGLALRWHVLMEETRFKAVGRKVLEGNCGQRKRRRFKRGASLEKEFRDRRAGQTL